MNTSVSVFRLCAELVGSLGLFLFGMKYMSEALQRLAGSGLRGILERFTSNRFKAIVTGTFVTAAVQSSSATTVMVVSFVNAGLLSLSNAIGVVMGSNIGTTLTAWIIAFLGIKYGIPAVPIVGLGFILMMIKSQKVKNTGEFLLGFGLLFLGLNLLQSTVEGLDLGHNAGFVGFFANIITPGSTRIGMGYILLFVLIGTILTMIVQASSAMLALSMLLCTQGAIPVEIAFEVVVAMVLGQNIGTTITANIAAVVGNVPARQAARAHLLFNVIGMLWVLVLFHPIAHATAILTEKWFGANPYVNLAVIPVALSLFHTFFNLCNTLLLVGFIPQIEKMTEFLVKKKPVDKDEIFKLEYIVGGFTATAEIAVESADKEVRHFAERMVRMFNFIEPLLNMKHDDKEYQPLLERIQHYEQISDSMEIEIANYLTKVSSEGLSQETNQRITGLLCIVDNLESIGDQNFQMAKLIEHKREGNLELTPEMKQNLTKMFSLVRNALAIMEQNLAKPYRTVEINDALNAENEINNFRDALRTKHLDDINNNVYSYQLGIIYSGMYALLEKVGDHIINISEAVVQVKYTSDQDII
ncbi:MAG: Na/Pi cotransporter family protein [Bacteroidales bacterium]|nr:Na/Pi cotransporter family protein [Bacteroidales bacterium]